MSQPIDATATASPPEGTTAAQPAAGWKLVQEAPEADASAPRDRAGAQRGMALLLAGGGLFWSVVAAAIWFATHRG